MEEYADDMKKVPTAISELIGKKQEIGVASLFSRGGTALQKEFYDGLEDFELVTFLVLQ